MAIAPGTTLADYLVPSQKSRSLNLLRNGLLVIGFSIFTALCAHVSFSIPAHLVIGRLAIPLPATPVPVTLQTLAVLLTGAALGSKRGGLALLVYLAEGAAGLPVFAPAPTLPGGVLALVGLTAGYLWAFPIAAFVVGWLCERGLDRSLFTSALAMLPGSVIIYLLGATWLGFFLHVNASTAFAFGVTPFLVGDLLKLVVAALLLPAAWGIVRVIKTERK